MIICLCRAVSDREVRRAITDGCATVSELRAACKAGTGCGKCVPALREMLERGGERCDDCPRGSGGRPSPYLAQALPARHTANEGSP